MTTPEIEPETPGNPETHQAPANSETAETPIIVSGGEEVPESEEKDERKRRLLLLLLLLLLLCLCCAGILFGRYLMKPEPLPQMLLPTQVAGVCYPPTYKFSIKNVDAPVAVAVSPDNQRIYVAESGGDRMVKMFDRDGHLINSFSPPGTDMPNREPKYMAVGTNGRVYLVDRTSNAIDIYDADGNFIDAIIGQKLTLSKALAKELGELPEGLVITHYEGINKLLSYQPFLGAAQKTIKVTIPQDAPAWEPLGLRFDAAGNLIYTDKTNGLHSVNIIPAADLNGDLSGFNPAIKSFGAFGSGKDQFDFPQTVVMDVAGNFYISDGNNARIDVWTPDMKYKNFFGFGSSLNGGLNLPRGTWMARGCLNVADAVGSLIRVYDVSGSEPKLAYELGEFGIDEGQFNYPVDVFIDGTGRLYVADRANNRIQVWSY